MASYGVKSRDIDCMVDVLALRYCRYGSDLFFAGRIHVRRYVLLAVCYPQQLRAFVLAQASSLVRS